MSDLSKLMQALGYEFKKPELLETALTHRSAGKRNNERLEFLGDSILNMMIGEALFHNQTQASEGQLSRQRANLVNGTILAQLAKTLGLGPYLILGVGERRSGGNHRTSIHADTLEALIGAIYLDSDLETTRQCIFKWYGDELHNPTIATLQKDAKSRLQEYTQAHNFPLPTYTVIATTGKQHAQTFKVSCTVEGLDAQTVTGEGTSRRRAEQEAANQFLHALTHHE